MTGNDDPTLWPTPPPSPKPDDVTLPTNNERTDIVAAKRFGDYELLDEIARGGMGVVYRARQVSLNRIVALKMILSGQFASESDVRRFYQEAESAANLDHSGIVPIYEIGEFDGHHFFSMKYIDGGSLDQALPELRKNLKQVVQLIADVARAVHHAHQRGILHRDLKPANILLDEMGKPLVSDLGLAKQIQSDSNITHTGAVVGTPAYMPPEQAAAEKEITTAADIYSVGAILYETLTGRPPHKADTPMKTLLLVLEGDVKRPRDIDNGVPKTLEMICMKCLHFDPGKRYASAAAFADDLENWLHGKSVSVRPPSWSSSFGAAVLTNVRSAFGAGAIGILAGLALSVLLGEGHTNGSLVSNPASKIYAALPAEIPWGRNLFYINESDDRSDGLVMLGFFACLVSTGLVVTMLTRPKPGPASLAMGVIAALLMTTTGFVLQLGPMAVASQLQDGVIPHIESLVDLGMGNSEKAALAKEQLAADFPNLMELSETERGKTLAYRILYDVLFRMPEAILGAFFVAGIFCIIPCVVGTTFSSKVLAESDRFRSIVFPYLELMTVVFVATLTAFFFMVLNGNNDTTVGNMSAAPPIGAQVMTMAIFGGLGVLLYRRMLTWRTRFVVYGGLIAAILCIANAN